MTTATKSNLKSSQKSDQKSELVEEIINFMREHGQLDWKASDLRKVIPTYLDLNTYVLVRNKQKEIIALSAFSVFMKELIVQECIIHKEYRFLKLIPYMVAIAWTKFPRLAYITFKRESKYEGRPERTYRIESFLRRIA